MVDRFLAFKAGHIFNKYPNTIEEKLKIKYNKINLEYHCLRLLERYRS